MSTIQIQHLVFIRPLFVVIFDYRDDWRALPLLIIVIIILLLFWYLDLMLLILEIHNAKLLILFEQLTLINIFYKEILTTINVIYLLWI